MFPRPLIRGGGGVAYYYLAFSEDGDAVSAVVNTPPVQLSYILCLRSQAETSATATAATAHSQCAVLIFLIS